MKPEELKIRNFESELVFTTSRSSGPGGQNVNKVNTRVELRFNVAATSLFNQEEKELIFRKLKNKINSEGELILVAQSERTQLMNKKVVNEKFYALISKTLTLPARRRATRPTLSSRIKRLEGKRKKGITKKLRKDAGDSSE